jgi:dTDP-4-dehydrorhamnose reductase
MLGHMVLRVLSNISGLTVDGTHRSNLTDPLYFDAETGVGGLRTIFEYRRGYDYVINCIGVTKSKIDELASPSVRRAIVVNALFPHELASFAAQTGAKVIHISTDGVFSNASDCYLEDAPHWCTDVYGKTKSLGEVFQPGFLNIRCSLIGPDPIGKRGLLEWFLSQPDGMEVLGYTHHLWNGVTTLQLAELCTKLVAQDVFTTTWCESPVHHFCANQTVTKYRLLELFQTNFHKNVTIKPSDSAGPPVRRVMATRYHSMTNLLGSDLNMELAVKRLSYTMCALKQGKELI